jgi:hypothetical protein
VSSHSYGHIMYKRALVGAHDIHSSPSQQQQANSTRPEASSSSSKMQFTTLFTTLFLAASASAGVITDRSLQYCGSQPYYTDKACPLHLPSLCPLTSDSTPATRKTITSSARSPTESSTSRVDRPATTPPTTGVVMVSSCPSVNAMGRFMIRIRYVRG